MTAPIIRDQYTATRVYFGCVMVMILAEGLVRVPAFLASRCPTWPFLQQQKGSARHWAVTVAIHKLLTLPLPRPLADYHGADILRFAVLAALNIVFALNDNQYTTDFKLYGWLALANGGLALLAAARFNLLSEVARVPSAVLLQYHRWLGTAHVAYNLRHYIRTSQLASSFESDRIRIGLVAWLSLAIMLLTALPVVRRRGFEIFYYAHALFFVFVVGALIHTSNGPEFLLSGLGLWAVDRALRFAYNFRRIDVLSVQHFEGGLAKFRVKGIRTRRPAQVVWVQVPQLSLLNWHPFTVATEPRRIDKVATVAVRGLGGFTRGVQHVVDDGENAQGAGVKMRLDGPHGLGRTHWGVLPVTVLVAGGIGITPAMSIASHLVRSTVARSTSHIHLLWIVKEAQHAQWFEQELHELHNLCCQEGARATLDVTLHATAMTDATGTKPDKVESVKGDHKELQAIKTDESGASSRPWGIGAGRPDIGAWFDQVRRARAETDVAVSVCGPRTLISEVRRAAAAASGKRGLFWVEEEVFEL